MSNTEARQIAECVEAANKSGITKRCPFCDGIAYFQIRNEGPDFTNPQGISLICSGSGCAANMYRARCYTDNTHTELEAPQALIDALVTRWNARAYRALEARCAALEEGLNAAVKALDLVVERTDQKSIRGIANGVYGCKARAALDNGGREGCIKH